MLYHGIGIDQPARFEVSDVSLARHRIDAHCTRMGASTLTFRFASVYFGKKSPLAHGPTPLPHRYYRKWFETYGPKTWLVYEDERYTFTKARQLYLALGMAIRGDLLNIKPGQRVGIVSVKATTRASRESPRADAGGGSDHRLKGRR